MDTKVFDTLGAANVARQAEWDKDSRITAAFRGTELGGELGEAVEVLSQLILGNALTAMTGKSLNTLKKLERERLGLVGSRATVAALMEELSDVVICAYLCAMEFGENLDNHIAHKFNATSEARGLSTRLRPPAVEPEKDWKWYAGSGLDAEHYSVGPFDTRDEAFNEAIGNFDEAFTIVEAYKAQPFAPTMEHAVERVLEEISEQEIWGEDGYDGEWSDDQIQELERDLQATTQNWLHRYPVKGYMFGSMRNKEEWKAREGQPDGIAMQDVIWDRIAG